MIEFNIVCPCCNEKILCQIDSDGNPHCFFIEEQSDMSQSELAKEYGIELGLVESEVSKDFE